MRLDEIVTLKDVLNSTHFLKLINGLTARGASDINVTRIKNQVLNSWRKGMKSRKHYDSLLNKIDISLNDLIDK